MSLSFLERALSFKLSDKVVLSVGVGPPSDLCCSRKAIVRRCSVIKVFLKIS